jgi:hypothetical protein
MIHSFGYPQSTGRARRQPRHHRSERHTGHFGDFTVVEPLDVAQHQRLAEWRRQWPIDPLC